MEQINNVQNLDSIIFYTGSNSVVAASTTESRSFGDEVDGYGTLTKGTDGTIYFSNFPNVKYKERNVNFANLNDLYEETLSYVLSNKESDEIVGNSYIAENKYNVIYTYETDLHNDFNNARRIVKENLAEFLIGLNDQKFNKQNKYGDKNEVSSIKIDQTYFTWYPKDTIAYYNTEVTHTPNTYLYFYINDVNRNVTDGSTEGNILRSYILDYLTEYDIESQADKEEYSLTYLNSVVHTAYEEFINQYLEENERTELTATEFVHSYAYVYDTEVAEDIPYKIGGNYYSYIRQSYATIDYKLIEKIGDKLGDFEERYNHDHSIYAYYMYDCNSDIEMMLTTLSLGVKNSTFKIGFDSRFNKWFDNVIDLHAELAANDTIANVTSGEDDAIFSIFKNSTDRITGPNVTVNKDVTHEFKTNAAVTSEDVINILTPYSIDTLDLSPIKTKIGKVLDLTKNNWMEFGSKLKKLIFDDDNSSTKNNLEKIFGINDIESLEYIDISNIDKLRYTPAIDKLENLKVFKAKNSNIDSFRPHKNNEMYYVELPHSVKSIKLDGNSFVPGTLKVAGVDKEFTGEFKYTPNVTLNSLTLRNIDDEFSYKLVYDWYDVLNAENKLDNVLYLELIGINWEDVPAENLINLKKFDLCPDFSGDVSIIGSGNYNMISRADYQNILKAYGNNAFVKGLVPNKIYKNLDIECGIDKEDFEFSMDVLNESAKAWNTAHASDTNTVFYVDTLKIDFNGYFYDKNLNTEVLISPYENRAANALLDIIYGTPNATYTFTKDVLEDEDGNDISNYAYCKLDRSIDTSDSDEIRQIKAGDILLFNGDTLMIFFKDVDNSIYEYTKLGSITDVKVKSYDGRREFSSIEHWFDYTNNTAELKFLPKQRPLVVHDITISASRESIESHDTDNVIITVTIPADVQANITAGKIENPNIIVETNSEHLTVVDKGNYKYELVPDYEFESTEVVKVSAYAEACRKYTEVSVNITLESDVLPSTVLDDTLTINSDDSFVDGTTLVLSIRNDAEYDPATQTLTIK